MDISLQAIVTIIQLFYSITVLSLLVFYFIVARRVVPDKTEPNHVKLTMSKLYQAHGIIMLLVFLGVFLIFFFSGKVVITYSGLALYSIFSLIILYGGFNSFMVYRFHKVFYNIENLTVISGFGIEKKIAWINIVESDYSLFNSSIILSDGSTKVYIHEYIKDFNLILSQLELLGKPELMQKMPSKIISKYKMD